MLQEQGREIRIREGNFTLFAEFIDIAALTGVKVGCGGETPTQGASPLHSLYSTQLKIAITSGFEA